MKIRNFLFPVLWLCSFVFGQSMHQGINNISKIKAQAYVGFLASDALKGRLAGSPENEIVAEYLASKFKEMGLKPFQMSFFQDFEALQSIRKGARWQLALDSVKVMKEQNIPYRKLNLKNVLGYIPGRISNEYVVIGAHYDHLGSDTTISTDGIYNGADDNASGVSAVLQIAEAMMADAHPPERNVIFAFWDGEEKGLLGSQYFVENFDEVKNIKSYLNFDMIGRNARGKTSEHVVFFYSKSHPEFRQWVNLGLERYKIHLIPEFKAREYFSGGSDNASFSLKGIPILWYHTDGHDDYHQPSDSTEQIS